MKIRDTQTGLRVIAPVLKFAASSFAGFLVDVIALACLMWLTHNLIVSIVGARILSAIVNFSINRVVVFRSTAGPLRRQAIRYTLVAGIMLASNLVWMTALTGWGVPWPVAKVLTELVLFVTSFTMQQRLVFGGSGPGPAVDRASPPAASMVSMTTTLHSQGSWWRAR